MHLKWVSLFTSHTQLVGVIRMVHSITHRFYTVWNYTVLIALFGFLVIQTTAGDFVLLGHTKTCGVMLLVPFSMLQFLSCKCLSGPFVAADLTDSTAAGTALWNNSE
jgi:hypothetical protein